MRKSYRHHNWTKKDSLWVRSKEILRDQRGYVNPYILGASAPAGFDKTDLISWWDLEEESGVRYDAHGSNDLTDNNTVGYAAGKVGNAADFERDNLEYLTIIDNPALSVQDIDFTVGFWFKLESAPGSQMALLSKRYDGDNNCDYQISLRADGKMGAYVTPDGNVANGTECAATTFGVVPLNEWHFLIYWHNATADTQNIQIDDGTVDSVAYSVGVHDGTADFALGKSNVAAECYDGLLDSVFFAKRLFTVAERTWLYNGGAGRAYSEL